ncbi:MAG: hypothetical protein IT382_16970 [Deltaproteobacteria bacterium]|nr:hypothetical protein [Deltaproteobacteria bacterium]
MNLTRERVRQIEYHALLKLKAAAGPDGIEPSDLRR